MPAAMPCKIPIESGGETHRNIGKRKTKYACVVDSDESTRPSPEGAGYKPHQDHTAAQGMNSLNHYSLVHKFIPTLQALKVPDAMAAVEKEWEKTGENSGMAADESQKQESSDRRSQE